MKEGSKGTARSAGKMLFFGALAAMIFVQVFVTFRGLSSPAGMDAAQLARELAAGNGMHTKVVRPYAWRQIISSGRPTTLAGLPDTVQPPLPALVLAGPFKLLWQQWDYTGASRIYLLDRVVAVMSVFFFVGGLGFSWLASRRLFDNAIAAWAILALMFSQPLWDVVRGGLGQAMAFCFFAAALNAFSCALAVLANDKRACTRHALGAGAALALLALTHDMAPWLIAGCAAAWFASVKPRSMVLWLLLPPLLAFGALTWRNASICGEFLGAGKASLQAVLAMPHDSWLLRDFSGHVPDVDFAYVLRRMLAEFLSQSNQLLEYLCGIVPAVLFFIALLHPFRKTEARRFRWALLIIWIFATMGMAAAGLPGEARDDRALHFLFTPLFSAYGFAFLVVLWTRLIPPRNPQTFWSRHGAAAMAMALSALPMAQNLPTDAVTGLAAKDRFAHWPPYLPDRIAKLRDLTKAEEIIFTDAPWAVAWYAGRTAAWLPMKSEQMNAMRAEMKKHGEHAAGIVLTPISAESAQPGDLFRGPYSDWTAQILRGYASAFGVDTQAVAPDFPYRDFHPLVGQPVGDRYIAEMVFLADRKRW